VNKAPDQGNVVHIETESSRGYALQPGNWEYFFEELLQAILEQDRQEAPFYLEVVSESSKMRIGASFLKRELLVNDKKMKWSSLKKFLSTLENIDLEETPSRSSAGKDLSISFDSNDFFKVKGKRSSELLQTALAELLPNVN